MICKRILNMNLVLVVNAGSSSLKYQLLNMDDESVIAKGNCDRIGIDGNVTHKVPATGYEYKASPSPPTLRLLKSWLRFLPPVRARLSTP